MHHVLQQSLVIGVLAGGVVVQNDEDSAQRKTSFLLERYERINKSKSSGGKIMQHIKQSIVGDSGNLKLR